MHTKPISGRAVAAEFNGVELERRLRKRLTAVVLAATKGPEKSFPKMMDNHAATDALYRFLSNDVVYSDRLLAPHRRQTVERIAQCEGDVLVLHDTTSIEPTGDGERDGMGSLGGKKSKGFFLHASLAVARETRRPLGALRAHIWTRGSSRAPDKEKKKRRGNETVHDMTSEGMRWQDSIEACTRSAESHAKRLIHICDSENDAISRMESMSVRGERFVIRLAHDRCVIDAHAAHVREAMACKPIRFTTEAKLSARKAKRAPEQSRRFPARRARTALLDVHAAPLSLRVPDYLKKSLGASLKLNVIRVLESAPPEGEKPVDWVLYTNEPIDSDEQVIRIVEAYRARWLIEEFFKALKTGCQIEKRQLESFHAMANALALFIPLAWQMLLVRNVARVTPTTAATEVLTSTQIEILNTLGRQKIGPDATAIDALLVIAGLGGHFKHNGPPGWQTLAAGFEKLVTWEQGWRAAREVGNR